MRLKSADLEDRVPAMLVVLGLFAGALALTVGTALGGGGRPASASSCSVPKKSPAVPMS
jgi:hypothetical protein